MLYISFIIFREGKIRRELSWGAIGRWDPLYPYEVHQERVKLVCPVFYK